MHALRSTSRTYRAKFRRRASVNSHFGMPFVDVSQRLGGQRRNLSGRSFIRRRWAARDYAEPKERNQLTSHRNQFSAQCFTWNQTEFQVWGADQILLSAHYRDL